MTHTYQLGEPIWVRQRDGSRRPGEYIGEATIEYPFDEGMAVVVFVDAPARARVDPERLSSRTA